MTVSPYSVLVNSSDGFEDCWQPFFDLFKKYWPDCSAPVYLNLERRDWQCPGVNLQCLQMPEGIDMANFSWSSRLDAALARLKTPLVLYLQEDYFLERPVLSRVVDEMAQRMMRDESIRHIGLTDFGSAGPFIKTDDPELWRIAPQARYRISTQAGLWRVDTLRSYLLPWETVWMLEIMGTVRAGRRKETFLTVNRDRYNAGTAPVIHYTPTGIIKGKWHHEMPAIFERNGISVNFSKRGFYVDSPALLRRAKLVGNMFKQPTLALRSLLG